MSRRRENDKLLSDRALAVIGAITGLIGSIPVVAGIDEWFRLGLDGELLRRAILVAGTSLCAGVGLSIVVARPTRRRQMVTVAIAVVVLLVVVPVLSVSVDDGSERASGSAGAPTSGGDSEAETGSSEPSAPSSREDLEEIDLIEEGYVGVASDGGCTDWEISAAVLGKETFDPALLWTDQYQCGVTDHTVTVTLPADLGVVQLAAVVGIPNEPGATTEDEATVIVAIDGEEYSEEVVSVVEPLELDLLVGDVSRVEFFISVSEDLDPNLAVGGVVGYASALAE